MKHSISFFLIVLISATAVAQSQNNSLNSSFSTVAHVDSESSLLKSLWPSFLSFDRQQLYRPRSLFFTLPISASVKVGHYWMSSMTTQSYNSGKLGTYYMWDVQGNLRESRMFLDIAGKNKRGLKLVFPRR
ncbi:MAG: hypothetical protein JJE09_13430 [Bacteroidia bacterium]|nr:hypothetical protein [Bacteroidia bacterium]